MRKFWGWLPHATLTVHTVQAPLHMQPRGQEGRKQNGDQAAALQGGGVTSMLEVIPPLAMRSWELCCSSSLQGSHLVPAPLSGPCLWAPAAHHGAVYEGLLGLHALMVWRVGASPKTSLQLSVAVAPAPSCCGEVLVLHSWVPLQTQPRKAGKAWKQGPQGGGAPSGCLAGKGSSGPLGSARPVEG